MYPSAVASAVSSVRRAFDIVPIDEIPREHVLDVLDQSLGAGHDRAWFDWKHRQSPFGPSLGWAAIGTAGILGVRLFMRWQLRLGSHIVPAIRPVDTATAPSARGRGIFRDLTTFAMAAVASDHQTALIFNTPNAHSRPGYSRMGWSLLPPLAHGVWPVWPGGAANLVADDAVFNAFEQAVTDPSRLCTARSANVMRWRYGRSSGVSYRVARLQQANTPNGIIYGVTARRGVRFLVVHELAGDRKERWTLLHSAARREGAWAFMAATGTGALNLADGAHVRRGQSVLAVRPTARLALDGTQLRSWALTLGDLERVM